MRSVFSLQVCATLVLCHVNTWVVVSVWNSENKIFAVDFATLQRQKNSLPLHLFPGLRRERRDRMHCARSEHPYSYMCAECSRSKWRLANKYLSHVLNFCVEVLWSLFHLLTGTSVRMEHGTASSASSDAVEIRMQRHCEMMQDGVAELLSFLLPSFVKLVFCWCVQPSVCRSLRQWFFAMSNSWVVFSVWKSENKCFAVDCATLQRQA